MAVSNHERVANVRKLLTRDFESQYSENLTIGSAGRLARIPHLTPGAVPRRM